MTHPCEPRFSLTGWNYANSSALVDTFLERLRRPDICEQYHKLGGLALSRDVAQMLADNRHFCGITTLWTHHEHLRLPDRGDTVVLEPSRPLQDWRSGEELNVRGCGIFARQQRFAMQHHMEVHGKGMWLARNYIIGELLTLDVGHSLCNGQAVLKATTRTGATAATVTMNGKTVAFASAWVMHRLPDMARYLAHRLPDELGITFGARLRCVANPERPSDPWTILDLRPAPSHVQAAADRF